MSQGYYNGGQSGQGYGGGGYEQSPYPSVPAQSAPGGFNQQQPQYASQPQYGGYNNGNGYGMKPPNNYAQQYQPPQGGKEQQYGKQSEMLDNVKPKWNDLIFALLFLAQFGAFIAVSVISLRALGNDASGNGLGSSDGNSVTLNTSAAYLLAIICGAGLVFSIILLLIVRAFTKIILEITLLLSVALSVAYAVYLWIEKFYSGAIIFTIFAVISVIAYFPMRRRIPFSRELLIFVLKIAKHSPSVYVLALLGAVIQTVYSVWWSVSIVAAYQKWSPAAAGSGTSGGTPSNGALIGICVFLAFSFYWTSQFITNFFLTTIAGIYGTYYFSGPGVPHAAWGAFKRASTYSMGSIAFGSLIVALLDLLRAVFQALQAHEQAEGDLLGTALACLAQCCIGCITWAVEYFNRYAYIEIALFGMSYIEAAKSTWRLFKDRGIDALVNDSLINNIWTFGSFAVGALCSAFAFLYLNILRPSYIDANDNLRSVFMLYAFFVGFFICHTLGYGALSSGASTIFVGLGEDPAALAERDPALFETIRRTYPKVVTSV